MIPFLQSKRVPNSVLGLWLDGSRLEGVLVRRTNGSIKILKSFAANLAVPPLTGDPQLVGREIRNHLDEAGIREKHCALCLPLHWALSMQVSVPDMPEADRDSFLQLEAERGFHSDDLLFANSLFKTAKVAAFATLLSVSRSHVAAIEAALTAAKLKPMTFGLGVAAMQPAKEEPKRLIFTLAVGANTVALQVTSGGGIVALRSLDGTIESEGPVKRISTDLVLRELRITLGQLPGELGEGTPVLRVFGQTEIARQLIADLGSRVGAIGLSLETASRASRANFEGDVPASIALSPALALAADYVRGVKTNPEFLPPKVTPWQQFAASRLSTRKLANIGGAVGFVAACVVLAFGIQEYRIHQLQAQWNKISAQVDEINHAQDQIVKYRAWYDDSFRALQILDKLALAFPQDGSVTAKTVEIRDLANVTCAGTAADNQSFLAMHSKLAKVDGVASLHAEVPRGEKPLQYSLNFQVAGAVTNGE